MIERLTQRQDNKNLSDQIKREPQRIAGLAEALFRGDMQKTVQLLSGVQEGQMIEVWDQILEVGRPTPQELDLITRSMEKRKEFGLISAGDMHEIIEGKRHELDDREVMAAVQRLATNDGKKVFSHTHWDNEAVPIPSGPDYAVLGNLTEGFGYECRVISWLSGHPVFIYRGRKSANPDGF